MRLVIKISPSLIRTLHDDAKMRVEYIKINLEFIILKCLLPNLEPS